jgi:hypothetical protein
VWVGVLVGAGVCVVETLVHGRGRRRCQDWSTKLTTWPLIEIKER